MKIFAPELKKEARVPCPHLGAKGCGIYDTRPGVCRQFLCGWRLFDDMGDDWRPDLSGVMALSWAPDQLPAAWKAAPYGVHMAILGGEAAVLRTAFVDYVARLMARGIPVFLSAASPYILLNEHLPAGADRVLLKTRLAELYPLLHAARFGRSLFKRIAFLYRLQIDRQRQKYLAKSNG
ncbi:MAG: YkgJ family cysteine cluster protein [Alphaproteobacteria bacterium]|nr:YkgJ family cysteine cluster protein [Alphaproteobacteria bacterium]